MKLQTVNINEINDMDQPYIIDIRTEEEYKNNSLPNTINIEMDELLSNPDKYLKKDQINYLMCASSARSKMTTMMLLEKGYNVVDLDKGICGYKR
ncbi:MAG: rhodanese-like domain-containing protein [Erysipelotrichales bacterium]